MTNKERAFEEYKQRTGYKTLSAVSAIAAHGAGYDARDNEVAELKEKVRQLSVNGGEIAWERDSLKKCIEDLEEALRFYADMNLYRMTMGGAYFIQESIPGTRAKKALEKALEKANE